MEAMYNYLFVEFSAPLTREWPLMSSPFPLMFIILGHLFFVLYAGPRYMKNRPPYKLKTFMLFYNVIQILSNSWFVLAHISSGWFSEYGVIISSVSSPDSPNAIKIFNIMWWLLLLKIFDLVDTYVIVLRKKLNQASFFHLYHHLSNVFCVWMYLKYVLDERATFSSLLNCAVHAVMYLYYLITSRGPKYQQILAPFKPYLVSIVMGHLIVVAIFLMQFANPACQLPAQFHLVLYASFIVNILINLYLFYDFYKTYTNVSKEKKN